MTSKKTKGEQIFATFKNKTRKCPMMSYQKDNK